MTQLRDVLTLVRPLTLFDVETTGTLRTDRIVQIAVTVHYPDKDPVAWSTLVNPGMPIPAESSAVHGITDEMVLGAPFFSQLAPRLAATAMTGCDFAGQRVTYDLRTFRAECKRVGVVWDWEADGALVIDTLRIRQIARPADLATLYAEATGLTLDDAHDAGADVRATEAVLAWQVREHGLPRDVATLAAHCWPKRADRVDAEGKLIWRGGEAVVAFGKGEGIPLRQMDRGWLNWVLREDFSAELKGICREALAGRFPVKEQI